MKVNELNDLRFEAREIVLSQCIYDALVRSSRTHDGTIKDSYVMRDVISGEYLPLTIEQFCNILPGDGDEIVAPSQAINWENSPIRFVRGEKGADSRHRNGLLIALLEKSMHVIW